ncbi:MAG: GspMb/PilO family protein [Candidatus Sumerlaeia bacterium]|nr:GspMb/PilO family protein [Candidatus Sumerlaeia bacterium]
MEFRKRERLLTVMAVIVVGAFLGDRLIVTPLRGLYKNRSERILELKKSLDQGRMLLDREKDIKARWEDMRKQALPTDPSVAENMVLQAMNRWIQSSRLTVTSLKPRWIEAERAEYKTLECRVAAQGNLPALARFLYELERDPLPLRVEEIEVSSRDDRGQVLTVGLRFTGLVLLGGK